MIIHGSRVQRQHNEAAFINARRLIKIGGSRLCDILMRCK